MPCLVDKDVREVAGLEAVGVQLEAGGMGSWVLMSVGVTFNEMCNKQSKGNGTLFHL